MILACSACQTPIILAPCTPPCEREVECTHCGQKMVIGFRVSRSWNQSSIAKLHTREELWDHQSRPYQIGGVEKQMKMPEGWRP